MLLATTKYITENILGKIRTETQDKLRQTWESVENNKLRNLMNSVVAWRSSDQRVRLNEVVLARLRIGPTLKTHQYLME